MNNFLFNVKKHLKTIIILLVVALTCFAFSLLNSVIFGKNSSEVSADFEQEIINKLNEEIQDNYWIGEEVHFPESISVQNGNDTVVAGNGLVIKPDNKVSSVDAVYLDIAGDYTVRYYYTHNNVTDFVEKNVFVGNKLASLSGENGSITPVSAAEQKGRVFENKASNVTVSGDDALIVRMEEGNTFQFTQSVDLSKTDSEGLVDIISLDYHLWDVERGAKNFTFTKESARYAFVKITDSYDPTIYAEFAVSSMDNWDWRYGVCNTLRVTAKAHNHARYSGVQPWESFKSQDGYGYSWIAYYKHADGTEYCMYNAYTPTLGYYAYDMTSLTRAPLTWKYDPVNQLVYINHGANKDATTDNFIHDLSADNLYLDPIGFDGFPSGKVTVSITTGEWVTSDAARFDIYSVGEISGSELIKQYNEGYHVDNNAKPIIDLGFEETEGNKIYVPMNIKYKVPVPVQILGGLSDDDYTVKAYVNYDDTAEFEVPIYNGEIVINKRAVYTLRYVAKGKNGAVGEKEIKLLVADTNKALTFSTDEAFFNGTFESGQQITLPSFNVTSINKQEEIKTTIKLVHSKYTKEISPETRTVTLYYSGDYKIVYEYSDNAFSDSKEFTFTAGTSENVGFVDELIIPKYFIKGAKYTLPNITGYLMAGGNHVPVATTVQISYDGGSSWATVNREEVAITGTDQAIVKYTCGTGAKQVSITSEPSRIIDVGYGVTNGLKLRDYFIHDNFTVQDTSISAIRYTSNVNSGNNTLKFVNPIDYANLTLKFRLDTNANYSAVKFSLIDYADPSVKYVVTYSNVNGIGCISYNGAALINTGKDFAATLAKEWNYSILTNKMSFEGQVLNTNLREYFKSDICYLEIELVNINGAADIRIDSLNTQDLTNKKVKDDGYPLISVDDFAGNYSVNDVVTINVPSITDTLSPILDKNIKLNVTLNGNYVKDVNGVTLNNVSGTVSYQIRLTEMGTYMVKYDYTDGTKKDSTTYRVIAVDDVKPVITFNKVSTTGIQIRTGTTIDASFVATDNVTPGTRLITSLWVRDMEKEANYTIDKHTKLIHFNYPGLYRVYAYAQDEAGNYVYNYFVVNVVD